MAVATLCCQSPACPWPTTAVSCHRGLVKRSRIYLTIQGAQRCRLRATHSRDRKVKVGFMSGVRMVSNAVNVHIQIEEPDVEGTFCLYRLADCACNEHFRSGDASTGPCCTATLVENCIVCCVRRRSMLVRGTFHKLRCMQDRTGVWNGPAPTGGTYRTQVSFAVVTRFVLFQLQRLSSAYNWKPVHTGAALPYSKADMHQRCSQHLLTATNCST